MRWLEDGAEGQETTATPTAFVAALAARLEVGDGEVPGLEVRRPDLEEVYPDLLGHSGASANGTTGGGTPPKDVLGIGRAWVGLELKVFSRDRESALSNFLRRMVLLFVSGSVFSGDIDGFGISFLPHFLAGMTASGIPYTSFQNLAIAISMERDDGALERLQRLPMPPAASFAGKVGTVLFAYLAQVILLRVVGVLFFGIELPAEMARWVTFGWVSLLGRTAATLLGTAFSAVPKQGKGASAIVAPIVLVLAVPSCGFFVCTDLPEWMQRFASVFPLRWLTQATRSVFPREGAERLEDAGSWQLGTTALVLAAASVARAVLASRFFRWTPPGSV